MKILLFLLLMPSLALALPFTPDNIDGVQVLRSDVLGIEIATLQNIPNGTVADKTLPDFTIASEQQLFDIVETITGFNGHQSAAQIITTSGIFSDMREFMLLMGASVSSIFSLDTLSMTLFDNRGNGHDFFMQHNTFGAAVSSFNFSASNLTTNATGSNVGPLLSPVPTPSTLWLFCALGLLWRFRK